MTRRCLEPLRANAGDGPAGEVRARRAIGRTVWTSNRKAIEGEAG